jgi:hypothetical protein
MNKKGLGDNSHIVLLAIVSIVALVGLVGLVLVFSGGRTSVGQQTASTGALMVTGTVVGNNFFNQPLSESCTNTRTGRQIAVSRCGQYLGMQNSGQLGTCTPHDNLQISNHCFFGCGLNNNVNFVEDGMLDLAINAIDQVQPGQGQDLASFAQQIRDAQVNGVGQVPIVLALVRGTAVNYANEHITQIDQDTIADDITSEHVLLTGSEGFSADVTFAENAQPVWSINNLPSGLYQIQKAYNNDGSAFVELMTIGLPVGDYSATKEVSVMCSGGDTGYFVNTALSIPNTDSFPG